MANPILIKKSITPGNAPSTLNIQIGELGQNAPDGKMYMRKYIDGTNGNDEIIEINPNEKGGVQHVTVGAQYAVGDVVNLTGSNFLYVCKTAHTSTVACDTAPDDTNWYQPGYSPSQYDYTTDLSGTACGSTPGGIHSPPPAPDENGPCWFSVALGSAGKTATILLEGFQLNPVDYDTTTDGYVKILSPVADNSWLRITL